MRVTLDSLRWRDQPVRATVTVDGGPPRVHLQMTTPREVEAMCLGRPVEELPRILSILSPAHHLCAAQALDGLFGVDPPPVARNTREAMRLALVLRHHLRKFHFLVSSVEDPFADFWPEGARRGPHGLRPLLEDLDAPRVGRPGGGGHPRRARGSPGDRRGRRRQPRAEAGTSRPAGRDCARLPGLRGAPRRPSPGAGLRAEARSSGTSEPWTPAPWPPSRWRPSPTRSCCEAPAAARRSASRPARSSRRSACTGRAGRTSRSRS